MVNRSAPGRSGFVAANLLTPVKLPGPLVVSDLDGRPDALVPGSANVGVSASGPAWSLDAGSIGVSGGAFYSVSGLAGLVSIGSDRPPNRIEATLYSPDYTNLAPIVAVRYIDANNFLFVQPGPTHVRVKKRVAGVDTLLTNGFAVPSVVDGVPFNLILDFTTGVFVVVWAGIEFVIAFNLSGPDTTLYAPLTRVAVGFRNDTGGPTPSSAARISNIRVYA